MRPAHHRQDEQPRASPVRGSLPTGEAAVAHVVANTITILAAGPFTITACRATEWEERWRSATLEVSTAEVCDDDASEQGGPAVQGGEPPRFVRVPAAQLPKQSRPVSAADVEALYGTSMLAPLDALRHDRGGGGLSTEVAGSGYHLCTVWGLLYDAVYALQLGLANLSVAGEASAAAHPESSCELHVQTGSAPTPSLQPPRLNDVLLDHGNATALLHRADFYEYPLAMGSEDLLLAFPPLGQVSRALPWIAPLIYHGLFPLPQEICPLAGSASPLYALLLVNCADRFVLDLSADAPTTRSATGDVVGPGVARHPWRRSRKVRRAIASGRYMVAVRTTPDDLHAALRRCRDCHYTRGKGEWLTAEMCAVLANLGECGERTFGTRVVCIDVVRRETGEVLAGCCGIECGMVYHDFSMYTAVLDVEGFGTLATKLVGEALERCGFDMWYWGIRADYMAAYEKRYGARYISREAFYERWVSKRDASPAIPLVRFLRDGHGMLPCYVAASP